MAKMKENRKILVKLFRCYDCDSLVFMTGVVDIGTNTIIRSTCNSIHMSKSGYSEVTAELSDSHLDEIQKHLSMMCDVAKNSIMEPTAVLSVLIERVLDSEITGYSITSKILEQYIYYDDKGRVCLTDKGKFTILSRLLSPEIRAIKKPKEDKINLI